LIVALSYDKFLRLADTTKSELYNILITRPINKENIEECFNAFKYMKKEDFLKRKQKLQETMDEEERAKQEKDEQIKKQEEEKIKKEEEEK